MNVKQLRKELEAKGRALTEEEVAALEQCSDRTELALIGMYANGTPRPLMDRLMARMKALKS